MPFYKIQDNELLQAPEFVYGPGFTLTAETKDEHQYPVEGWYWFDTLDQAMHNLRSNKAVSDTCTPAQGLIALYTLKGITEQNILDAIVQIPDSVQRYTAQIGYSRAITWERESQTMQAMAALLNLSGADLDALFAHAAGVQV